MLSYKEPHTAPVMITVLPKALNSGRSGDIPAYGALCQTDVNEGNGGFMIILEQQVSWKFNGDEELLYKC